MRWPQKYLSISVSFNILTVASVTKSTTPYHHNWNISAYFFVPCAISSLYNFCIAPGWHEDMTYLQRGIDVTNALPITLLGPGAELQLLNQSVTRKLCALLWTVDTRVLQLWYRYSPYSENRNQQAVWYSKIPKSQFQCFEREEGAGRILPQVLCMTMYQCKNWGTVFDIVISRNNRRYVTTPPSLPISSGMEIFFLGYTGLQ